MKQQTLQTILSKEFRSSIFLPLWPKTSCLKSFYKILNSKSSDMIYIWSKASSVFLKENSLVEGFTNGSTTQLLLMMSQILSYKDSLESVTTSSLTFFPSPHTSTVTRDDRKPPIMKLSILKDQHLPQSSTFTSIECHWLKWHKVESASTRTVNRSISGSHHPRCSTTQEFTCIQSLRQGSFVMKIKKTVKAQKIQPSK